MALSDILAKIVGTQPFRIGELNKHAAQSNSTPPRIAVADANCAPDILVPPEYDAIHQLLISKIPLLFVNGKAGTGKTTLIRYLESKFHDRNVAVLAPTGVAAINAGGQTLHSFFRLPPRFIFSDDIKEVSDRKLYRRLDLVIIDEISMVRADVIDAIDKFLRLNGREPEKPFGGVPLLFLGDLFQLPPVVTREEEKFLSQRDYATPYFFSALCLQELDIRMVELTRVYRQADMQFSKMLSDLRLAENVAETIRVINDECALTEAQRPTTITLTCTNSDAEERNEAELSRCKGETYTFIGEKSGKFRVDQNNLPAPMNLQLRLGAQVMLTKNDEGRRWVNGTLAVIKGFENGGIQASLLDDPATTFDIRRVKWESYKYTLSRDSIKIVPEVIGKYEQFPMMLAWAVTIHKSQGKTLDNVTVDLGNGAFAPGQVYVALSRCRTLDGIRLKRALHISDVRCDLRIRRFFEAANFHQKA